MLELNEDDRPYKGALPSRFVTGSFFYFGIATFFPLTRVSEGYFMLFYYEDILPDHAEKVDLRKGYWNAQKKIRVATQFFELISLESQQKC